MKPDPCSVQSCLVSRLYLPVHALSLRLWSLLIPRLTKEKALVLCHVNSIWLINFSWSVYYFQPLQQLQLLQYSKLQMAETVVVWVYNTYIPCNSRLILYCTPFVCHEVSLSPGSDLSNGPGNEAIVMRMPFVIWGLECSIPSFGKQRHPRDSQLWTNTKRMHAWSTTNEFAATVDREA